MIPVADPFMAGHEPPTRRPGDFTRSKRGTPYVSDPTGKLVKPKRKSDPPRIATTPYSRPSGFGKIIEDMYSIHKWDQRQEAYGFAVDPTLVERAAILIEIEDRESDQWKDEADKIIGAAKAAAKSSIAADRGGHAHALAEDDDEGRDIITRIAAGEELGLTPDVQRSLVAAWQEMLERDGLEILAVEMPVVNDLYRAAGTLDRVARLAKSLRFRLCTGELVTLPTGLIVILDIKSGKRRLAANGTVMYWHGYAVQVFLYDNGVPYNTETDTRGEWEWRPNGKWALIAHLDVLGAIDGKPSCELILVDLEAGKRAADLCVAAKAWSTDTTVFSVAQIMSVDGVEPPAAQAPATPSTDTRIAELATINDLVERIAVGTKMFGKRYRLDIEPLVVAQIVEGVGEDCPALASETTPSATVGEEAGAVVAGPSPTSSILTDPTVNDLTRRPGLPQHALDEIEVDRLNDQRRQSYQNWPLADPDRLALVDARNQLITEPDQGADLSVGFDELWDQLHTLFQDLPPDARRWRSEMVMQATQRHVPFNVQTVKTERTYHLNSAIIGLAIVGMNDEVLRGILALVVGDVALFPSIQTGHLVGSLGVKEAERFAELADAYIGDRLESYVDDGCLRYREPFSPPPAA